MSESEEVTETTALAVAPSASLFRSDEPDEIIVRATAHANALAGVIDARKLYSNIRGRKHVLVEGWTLLGSMLGVFPVCVWSRPIEGGWEARVEARTRTGEVVGAAEAQCVRAEKTWQGRDDFALRSMAQTRATSKALRLPLGFIMVLAGYEATPMEEMPTSEPEPPVSPPPPPVQAQAPQKPMTGAKVTRQQVAELMSLVSQKGADKTRFLAWAAGVAKLPIANYEDIPAALYDDATKLLRQKADKPAIQPEKGEKS